MVSVARVQKVGSNMAHKKVNLPQKDCAFCHRPFSWRKKWERCWDEVKYCSQRCKRSVQSAAKAANKNQTGISQTAPNICAAASVEDEF